jgi:hypothetical protein
MTIINHHNEVLVLGAPRRIETWSPFSMAYEILLAVALLCTFGLFMGAAGYTFYQEYKRNADDIATCTARSGTIVRNPILAPPTVAAVRETLECKLPVVQQ